MGQIRSALRALALLQAGPGRRRHRARPAGGDARPEAMATLAYGVLHVPSGRLRLVLAGHPPPLVRNAGGAGWVVERVTGEPGLPLGALPGTGYTAIEAELAAGSTLLLYSDGLVETAGARSDRQASTSLPPPSPRPGTAGPSLSADLSFG
jgi:hypothetical protein